MRSTDCPALQVMLRNMTGDAEVDKVNIEFLTSQRYANNHEHNSIHRNNEHECRDSRRQKFAFYA